MAGYKLLVSPRQASYAVTSSAEEVSRTQLAGGMGRYRSVLLNASRLVNVMWRVPGDIYEYLETFRAVVTAEGSVWFRIDLLLDKKTPVEYEALFIPGSWSLTGIEGRMHIVTAQLEVQPKVRDIESDSLWLALVEEYGFAEWEADEELIHAIVEDLWSIPHP